MAGKRDQIAARLRALVLLLRYSGLRIRDAVTLNQDRVRDGKLFLLHGEDRNGRVVPAAAVRERSPGGDPAATLFLDGGIESEELRRELAAQLAAAVPPGRRA